MTKKFISMFLALAMCLSLSAPAFATEESSTEDDLLQSVSEFLDNSPTTQTITVTEQEMFDQMLEDGTMTREDLNNHIEALARKSKSDLEAKGYNEQQIELIKSYTPGTDAYSHLYEADPFSRAISPNAEVKIRFGLAGSDNTPNNLCIAYDIRWSDCPMCTFYDSFGIGWIAANSDSDRREMKIDSCSGTVRYYLNATNADAHISENIDVKRVGNIAVVGVFNLEKGITHYGKTLGGLIELSTQSNSNNIATIQIFVAYAHTTLQIGDPSLTVGDGSKTITFVPKLGQSIIAEDQHTFEYDSQDVWPDKDF